MFMHNSSELSNALNPNISQDHRIAYAQILSTNYAQSYSVAQNSRYHHQEQPQPQQHPVFFSGSDASAGVRYAQPQYHEHQQQDSQSQLQQTPTPISQENVYIQSAQQQEFDCQTSQEAYSASQEQQTPLSHLQQQPQLQDQHQHSQQQYYDASQAQSQPSANLQDSYSTSTPRMPNQYMATFGDAQSGGHAATTNYSALIAYPNSSTSYAPQNATSMTQNIRPASQYPQYPSPRSAHTTPHVQHHQVSMHESGNTQPAASSSYFPADLSQISVRETYVPPPPTIVETPTVDRYLPTTHNGDMDTRAQTSCDYASVLPTPALEPRQTTPTVQPCAQQQLQSQSQANQQPRPPQAGTPASESAAPPPAPVASLPVKTAPPSSQPQQQQQQQRPQQQPKPASRATDRMIQALPHFMMETFKVIRKEKGLNEEERKRRVAWEEAHEERQSRSEAELKAQQKKLEAMEERLAKMDEERAKRDEEQTKRDEEQTKRDEEQTKRDKEQAKRDEEQAKRDEKQAKREEELSKREEELKREKMEVDERLKDVESKMAEIREMIEAVRVAALAPPTPNPVVAQSSPLPVAAPQVPIPVPVAAADQAPSKLSNVPDNEQNFVESSPQLQLDSPELFAMSPDLDLDPFDDEPDLPPVSSITAPRPQEESQPVASTSSYQPSHSSMPALPMYYFPIPPPHTHVHTHAPTPGAYHFPTPAPYYPYHHMVPPSYDTGSTAHISEFNSQSAAAQYITPNLTPDLAPATVVTAQAPERPPQEETVTEAAQKKRKSKSKHQKKAKKKRKRRASDDSDDDEDSSEEFASEGGSSVSEESEVEIERRRRPKRVNGHDKKIYTLPHALRAHIYSMMEIISDKELPDSHDESAVYHPSQPVRFVWEKTCKQSVHNARMKLLVLEDIREKRARLYPQVPVEDFSNKAMLEKKFDHVFETMRGKYKAQRSEELAKKERERDVRKARNSRHSARRTAKLSDRSETRLKMPKYEPVVFDPALLRECMSSDESDVEVDPVTQVKVDIHRSRGPAWRSARLVKFYKVLEDNKAVDPNVRPKGGVGKKRPRRAGPPKDEFILPPKGVAPWMVSRRWVERARKTHVDLEIVLGRLVADEYVLDGEMYEELGEESEAGENDGDEGMEMDAGQTREQQELPTQSAQMRTLRLGLQPQQPEAGPAFSGRYTLQ